MAWALRGADDIQVVDGDRYRSNQLIRRAWWRPRGLRSSMWKRFESIHVLAERVRLDLEVRYRLPLTGRGVEASEILASLLKREGFAAAMVEGRFLYENADYGTPGFFGEHSWCEVQIPNQAEALIVDVTLDQFQASFYAAVPRIFSGSLPRFLSYSERPS